MLIIRIAKIAQMVEQWIEAPRVTSSTLVLSNYVFSLIGKI